MKITLSNIGKKFNRNWIFRGLNKSLELGKSYAVLGANGSGKSTLLKLISGFTIPSEGDIKYETDQEISQEKIYKSITCVAPYLEIYEEYTIPELIAFQKKFKPFTLSDEELLSELNLPNDRVIEDFSSGMKQKVKLGLALFSNSPILLFDEPTINLDAKAKEWYVKQIQKIRKNRLVLICSNYEDVEYNFCEELIQIENFKAEKASGN